MPAVQPFNVDPLEAIEYLGQKLDVPTATWTDLWQDMHARAFVVAGAQGEELLADFHDAINRAIVEGRTLEQFRADFDSIVAHYGWSYNGSRNWRSRVIFETNLRMAYSAGRWAQIQRVKKQRPYLRYVTMDDDRVRPQHRLWHNVVLPVDHAWWHTHFPPNGWGCRCLVQSLNERDLKRYDLRVQPEPPASPIVRRMINTPQGPVATDVPKGIDPGFGYNPGIAAWGRGADLLALEKHGTFIPLDAPGVITRPLQPLPIDTARAGPIEGVRPGDEAGLRAALRAAIGGDEAEFVDPLGARISVSQAIVDHMLEVASRQDGRERYFGLIPELLEEPAEIWVGFAKSDVSGRALLRRRYVKLIRISRNLTIGLVADADGRRWSALTFFRGDVSGAKLLRTGLLVYRRP